MRAPRRRLRRTPAIGLGTSGLLLLGSCASLGGNVRGSFSCDAPDGMCAPSSRDRRPRACEDRWRARGGGFIPAAGPMPALGDGRGSALRASSARCDRCPGMPARTRERVLRIVFQPYIDERGRLHEATAVHAVVASGDWEQQVFASTRASAPSHGCRLGIRLALPTPSIRPTPLKARTRREPLVSRHPMRWPLPVRARQTPWVPSRQMSQIAATPAGDPGACRRRARQTGPVGARGDVTRSRGDAGEAIPR